MGSTDKDETESSRDPIQDLLQQSSADSMGTYDPDQSLRRVLSHARQQTATRDIVSFFMSWIWMLFAGFGASMYQANQRRHPRVQRSARSVSQKAKPSSE